MSKLKNENILADIYIDTYDETHCGFVLDFNDDFLLIEKYHDSDFVFDGITIVFRQNISRIRWSGNELTIVAKFIDPTKRQPLKIQIDLASPQTILRDVYDAYGYVTVFIQELDREVSFIGQIHEMDDKNLVIHEYGTKMSLDRKFILLSLEDITRIDAGDRYEENLKKIFNS